MKITKYKHACLVLEKDAKSLVIDPGDQSDDLVVPSNTVAIVITHAHPDHLDIEKIQKIVSDNPGIVVIGHADVVGDIKMIKVQTVVAGDSVDVAPFHLEFFGEKHAMIHASIPLVTNLGVLVNESLYYPGDSYTLPGKVVDTLALPTSGPWLKVGETVDFALAVKPRQAFSTHDVHLSEPAVKLVDFLIPMLTKSSGMQYIRINGTIEIDG